MNVNAHAKIEEDNIRSTRENLMHQTQISNIMIKNKNKKQWHHNDRIE